MSATIIIRAPTNKPEEICGYKDAITKGDMIILAQNLEVLIKDENGLWREWK